MKKIKKKKQPLNTLETKTLRSFINDFDLNKPEWSSMSNGFPECDLEKLDTTEIGKFNAVKTIWEISQPKKPKQRSRVWESTDGYKFLVQWSNAVLLRLLAKKVISTLKSTKVPVNSSKISLNSSNSISWKLLDRTEAQLLDSLRSVIANIEEGFARPTTSEYLQFLGYSQASLKEAKGDFERMLHDELIKSIQKSSLKNFGIDLKNWNEWCKVPANNSKLLCFPLGKNKGNYRKLKDIKGCDLTYEIFIELVNKTDYLLRKLVESLEKKLDTDRKGYKVEKARIRSNLRNR